MLENDSLFKVDIENYNGPLEVLLDLAKAQKVNLENISITKLADQFYEFITKQKNLNLEIASEYLLMATWLAYLKSKLLLPGTCLLYTSPSPRDATLSRMPSSA